MFTTVYGIDAYDYMINREGPSAFVRALNNGFHRVAWAAGIGWIVFASFHGYGGKKNITKFPRHISMFLGFINDFLSWGAFNPLAKLSFLVYLVHFDFLNFFYSQVTHVIVGSQLYAVR